ncbi:MAG: siphovirus ReqiPepy6 Gp37-like family protein [Methanoregula sp.]|nr:siphovirus ReqiPepy6 Gp37-like family protein [Methanoregula sp.]MDD5187978.1 siphovirus ReqiPepy6 Gp37-like family protein [Methanoregula sp.]
MYRIGITPIIPSAGAGVIPEPSYKPYRLIRPTIRVYDASMNRVGEITAYQPLVITENWYSPHEWELTVHRDLPGSSVLVEDGWIEAYWDSDTLSFLGLIESRKPVITEEGKNTSFVTVAGRGALAGVLKKRMAMAYFSAGDGYDTQTSVAYETAMRHVVDVNCVNAIGLDGSMDTSRNLSGVTLAPYDLLRGGTADELKTRGDKLLDLLESWSKTSGLHPDMEWSGSGLNFEFQVSAGTDRSGAGSAARVVLTSNFGSVSGYEYEYSKYDSADTLYVAGAGDGASRLVQKAYSGSEPTGWSRNEAFIDASDCDSTDALTTRGEEQLIALAPTQSLSFTYNWLNWSARYKTDFFLGDIVIVDFPGEVTMTSRVISVQRTYDGDGLTMEITIGTESPDLRSIVKKLRASTSPIRRR